MAVRKLEVVSEAAIKNVFNSSISSSLEMWLSEPYSVLFLSSINSSTILLGFLLSSDVYPDVYLFPSVSFKRLSKSLIVPSQMFISYLSAFLHLFFSNFSPNINRRGS